MIFLPSVILVTPSASAYPAFPPSFYHYSHLRSTSTGMSGDETPWSDKLHPIPLLRSALDFTCDVSGGLYARFPVSSMLFNGINVCFNSFILHASVFHCKAQFYYVKGDCITGSGKSTEDYSKALSVNAKVEANPLILWLADNRLHIIAKSQSSRYIHEDFVQRRSIRYLPTFYRLFLSIKFGAW